MIRVPVQSSMIREIGHEGDVLEVMFANGSVKQFAGVPRGLYREMLTAESIGTFFNRRIRGHYDVVGSESPTKPAGPPAPSQAGPGIAVRPDPRGFRGTRRG